MATKNPEKLLYEALNTTGYDVYPQYTPQNKSNPFVIYNVTSDTVENTLDSVVDVKNVRFQVDIYADGYGEIKQMRDIVYGAIYNISEAKVMIYGSNDLFTEDGRRIRIDLKLWTY